MSALLLPAGFEDNDVLRRRTDDGTHDVGPAKWAVGVELEPGVYAVDVEGVAAAGEQLEPLLVEEFTQTDGALAERRLFPPGGEGDDGDGADGGWVEAAELGGEDVDDGGDVQEVSMAMATEGEEAGVAAPAETAPDDEEVVADEDDGGN